MYQPGSSAGVAMNTAWPCRSTSARVPTPARVRNLLKQVSASTPPRAAPMLSPEVSRSLVHRLASSRSRG